MGPKLTAAYEFDPHLSARAMFGEAAVKRFATMRAVAFGCPRVHSVGVAFQCNERVPDGEVPDLEWLVRRRRNGKTTVRDVEYLRAWCEGFSLHADVVIANSADLDDFIVMAIHELNGLHEGSLARYRLRPSEFRHWQFTQVREAAAAAALATRRRCAGPSCSTEVSLAMKVHR